MLANVIRFVFCLLLVSIAMIQPGTARAVEGRSYTVEIADVGKSRELAAQLEAKGYRCVVPAKNIWVVDPQNNSSVWIGKNVPLEMLRVVLPEAMRFNPYLKFFYVVGDRGEKPPQAVDDTVHVGGSIEAALVKKLNVIDQKEMLAELDRASNIEELHRFLHEKNKPKPEADKPAS